LTLCNNFNSVESAPPIWRVAEIEEIDPHHGVNFWGVTIMAALRHHRLASALLPLLGISIASPALFAQDATTATGTTTSDSGTPAAGTKNTKQMQQVVVTGTRSTNRTVAESISPIQVVSPKELTETGYTDIASALNSILPSLDFPHQSGDNNIALRAATLRGLSPDDVLVLVDGVRYHSSSLINYNSDIGRGSSPVDLNSIPVSAIDHIEVLTDGAAAQYGSDAIAGVINIILKHGATAGGNSITANTGFYNSGGGASNGVQGSVGLPLGGPEGNAPGWLRLSWNYQNQMRGKNLAVFGDQTPADAAANGGYLHEYLGEPKTKTYQVAINFGYDLTSNIQAYGNLLVSRRSGTGNSYWRTPLGGRDDTDLYPNGYVADMTANTNDLQSTIGVKGKTDSDWIWNAYASYGINNIGIDVDHSDNIALWQATGSSPANFYAGGFVDTNAQANADLSKEFQFGFLPNPVTVAFGAQFRQEGYKVNAGDPSSYFGSYPASTINGFPAGSQDYAGLTPEEAGSWKRNSAAAYVDLETDLTSKLSVGFAGRYEHYNQGIGATRSGKLSMRYQATDSFALRGTISNGFRAPTLASEHYESTTTSVVGGVLTQQGTFPTSSVQAMALGARPLTPEKSSNYSIGAVWQPTDAWSTTLDLYQVRIWNQILYSDALSLSNSDGTPNALGDYFNATVPGQQVSTAQFFTNAATTRTRGAELVSNYHLDLSNWGKLDFNLAANYNHVKVLSVRESDPVLTQYAPTQQLFGPGSIGLLEGSAPRTKFVLGARWGIQNWGVNLNETRYGSVTRYPAGAYSSTDYPQLYAGRWLTDLAVNYTWKQWSFDVAANNLFNIRPTKMAAYNDGQYMMQFQYDTGISPFAASGGFYNVSVTYHF
jgi:iron complex outermembrane receptor protein